MNNVALSFILSGVCIDTLKDMEKSTGNSAIFYEVNGCKFKNEAAGMCKLLMDCTTYLCQFTHKKDASENVDNASVDKVRIEPSIKSSKEEKN